MSGDNQPQPSNLSTARPSPILGAAFALGLLFDYLLYGKLPGVGYALFVVAIVAGTLMLSRRFGKPLSRAGLWFMVLAVLFAAAVAIRASHELTFMNIVLSLFLLLVVVSEAIGYKIREWPIEKYFSLAWLPFHFLGNIGLFFSSWFSQRNGEKRGKISAIIRGVLLALPVLLLFTLLFSSADLVFQKYAKEIIDIDISLETLIRIFLVFVVTLGFSGAWWYVFTKTRLTENIASEVKRSSLGSLEMRILLGSINVLFLLFIVVQLRYLFGGNQSIIDQGFTYAEYARRGFFELIAVAVISWLVTWTIHRSLVYGDATTQRATFWLSAALIVQVFVIMASAFMRLVLYEQGYGFTTLRFYSHVFIIWLAVVFVLLLYKLFMTRREDWLAFSILISVLTFAGAVNAFNPDAFIARQNIQRYSTIGKIDVWYLDQLSPDAVSATLPLLQARDTEVAKAAANRFYWKLQRLDVHAAKWQTFSLGRQRARTLLRSNRQLLEEQKDYVPILDFLQSQSVVTD